MTTDNLFFSIERSYESNIYIDLNKIKKLYQLSHAHHTIIKQLIEYLLNYHFKEDVLETDYYHNASDITGCCIKFKTIEQQDLGEHNFHHYLDILCHNINHINFSLLSKEEIKSFLSLQLLNEKLNDNLSNQRFHTAKSKI